MPCTSGPDREQAGRDVNDFTSCFTGPTLQASARTIKFSPCGKRLVVVSRHGDVDIHDAVSLRHLTDIHRNTNPRRVDDFEMCLSTRAYWAQDGDTARILHQPAWQALQPGQQRQTLSMALVVCAQSGATLSSTPLSASPFDRISHASPNGCFARMTRDRTGRIVDTTTGQVVLACVSEVLWWHPEEGGIAMLSEDSGEIRGIALPSGAPFFPPCRHGVFRAVVGWAPAANMLVCLPHESTPTREGEHPRYPHDDAGLIIANTQSQQIVLVTEGAADKDADFFQFMCLPNGRLFCATSIDYVDKDRQNVSVFEASTGRMCYHAAAAYRPGTGWQCSWLPNGKWAIIHILSNEALQVLDVLAEASLLAEKTCTASSLHVDANIKKVVWCPDGCSIAAIGTDSISILGLLT